MLINATWIFGHKLLKILALITFLLTMISSSVCAQEKVLENLKFDKKRGIISYELTKPAWVRIRVGIQEGPLYKSLVDWEKRGKGLHMEKWNGMDYTGTFNIMNNPKRIFTSNYFIEEDELYNFDTDQGIVYTDYKFIGRAPKRVRFGQLHKEHGREFCYDPKIEIIFPEDIALNSEDYPIIKQSTPIQIKINREDAWFEKEGYAIHIFVDNIFLSGEEQGYSPYIFKFSPFGINRGKHLITVNLKGLYDHIGIGQAVIFVE